jgi:hypothetical protein
MPIWITLNYVPTGNDTVPSKRSVNKCVLTGISVAVNVSRGNKCLTRHTACKNIHLAFPAWCVLASVYNMPPEPTQIQIGKSLSEKSTVCSNKRWGGAEKVVRKKEIKTPVRYHIHTHNCPKNKILSLLSLSTLWQCLKRMSHLFFYD